MEAELTIKDKRSGRQRNISLKTGINVPVGRGVFVCLLEGRDGVEITCIGFEEKIIISPDEQMSKGNFLISVELNDKR